MGGHVGGDPHAIGSSGRAIGAAATRVSAREQGVRGVGSGGCDGTPAGEALARFLAVYGRFAHDLGTELTALGLLARNTGADLTVAGGGRVRAE